MHEGRAGCPLPVQNGNGRIEVRPDGQLEFNFGYGKDLPYFDGLTWLTRSYVVTGLPRVAVPLKHALQSGHCRVFNVQACRPRYALLKSPPRRVR